MNINRIIGIFCSVVFLFTAIVFLFHGLRGEATVVLGDTDFGWFSVMCAFLLASIHCMEWD